MVDVWAPLSRPLAAGHLVWGAAKDEVRLQQGPDGGSGGHRREMGTDKGVVRR